MELKPGYKQTEIGVIPEDWEVCSVREISTVVRGGSPRPAGDPRYFNGDFIPWLTVAALTNIPESELFIVDTFGYLTEEGAKFSRTLEKGTLIIANSGATLGVAKILGITCCANDGIAALIDQKSGDKQFICYYINSQTKRLREVVATGNGQPNLNTELIGNILIPLPPLEEQRAIAAALREIDGQIAALDELIAKKRDLEQGAMQELLTGDRRLPGFSREWKKTTLDKIGTFTKGRGIKKDDVIPDGIPCIRYGEIYTRYNDYIRDIYSFIPRTIAEESQRLKQGDLLFAGSGETAEEIGKCIAFLDDREVYAGGDIVIFSPQNQNSMYLGYLLNHISIVIQKARMGQGDAVVHISARNLGQLELHLPEIEEQTAIASLISEMDTEIETLEAERDKTRALKQGMMHELLTGNTRLL